MTQFPRRADLLLWMNLTQFPKKKRLSSSIQTTCFSYHSTRFAIFNVKFKGWEFQFHVCFFSEGVWAGKFGINTPETFIDAFLWLDKYLHVYYLAAEANSDKIFWDRTVLLIICFSI